MYYDKIFIRAKLLDKVRCLAGRDDRNQDSKARYELLMNPKTLNLREKQLL